MIFLLVLALVQADPLLEARRLAEDGRAAEAIELLRDDANGDPRQLALLAELLAHEDRIPEAEEALGRALRHAPDQAGLAVTRASLLFQLSRYDEARGILERVLARHPDHPFAHYFLGAILLRVGETEAAVGHARRATEAAGEEVPPRAEALHLLGEALLATGEHAAGEAALREALALAPWLPGPTYLLGRELLRTGRDAEGARMLDRFSRVRRAAEAVETGIALLPRDPAAARALFEEALRFFPGHPEATRQLARTPQ